MQASGKRKIVAVVLGLALVVALGAFIFSDPGDPSIPDGAVAVVEDAPDGAITQEEYDENLRQAAFNLQLRELPPEDDPQFEQIEQSALSNSIQTRWVKGEAEERGITVSEQDVDRAFDQIVEQQLGGQKGYEEFLKQSEVDGEPAFDEEAVRAVAELTAISNKLQDEIASPDIGDEQIERYYDENAEQFETPESRDVRVILNPDAAKIDQALEELGDSPTPEDWDRVAKKYSTDEATKNQGGLRTAVTEGQNEPALNDAIFNTEEGEVVGPIEGESGFYALQVEKITAGRTEPLDGEGCDTPEAQDPCLREQIQGQLEQGVEAQAIDRFRNAFIAKWTSRTFCGEVTVDLCANADPPPEACTVDDASERESADAATLDSGCPAFVAPRNVVNPAAGGVFPGEQLPVLPQGPVKPASEQPAALPPGATPIGPGGAPPPTGGAPPPTGAPPAQP